MLILASASPRRNELLRLITEDFSVLQAPVEEKNQDTAQPAQLVEEQALLKAQAVFAAHPKAVVIGADTIVALDGHILGKPVSQSDAVRMLQSLSGRHHQVYTGVAVLSDTRQDIFSVKTEVEFIPLSNEEIRSYVETGEPMDKAGAYGIQEKGALFVKSIHGDFFNVMGLPVSQLYQMLKEYDHLDLL